MVKEIIDKIEWLGHDTFRISNDLTIYFDPYQIKAGKAADIIFVTHPHFDHCSPEDIEKIKKDDTVIVTEKEAAKMLSGKIEVMSPGDESIVKGVEVKAVPAYNIGKTFHPKHKGWLGFIIEIKGVRIYHAGDTDLIPEMKDIKTDIALLPVSGTYVMTAEEAIQAALAIKPQVAIPMHYGAIVGSQADAERFAKGLKEKIEVVILPKTE
ncbi:MAG TPA: MBL fold metallo-hydrolase [Candidatus Desulfofervidus auxilii]|uniref:MBL fold metallo-hydrolase n=1 Tax=Desulfofervidus auxilii TaxID=1621989 RepID=A0A7V0IAL7_DESA2|nr:MBL fold metallo-hydrolase [Candidatus Desulfofervidus auxilii]